MHGDRTAQLDGGANARNEAGSGRTRVRCVDVEPHRDVPFRSHQVGVHRTERLTQHEVCPAVQQLDRLRVALDRHRGHGTLRRELEKLDFHLVGEGTEAALANVRKGVLS